MTKGIARKASLFCCLIGILAAASIAAQGKWEIGAHYSRWSLSLIESAIEDSLNETLESDIKDRFLDDIRSDYPRLRESGYTQKINIDSSGDNYGLEIRYYPGGENGSFSLGFSLEKTTMKVTFPENTATLSLEDEITHTPAVFEGRAGGEFLLKPFSFHLSVRWDILPSSAIHPYVTLGLGASTAKAISAATYSFEYSGVLTVPGHGTKTYSDSDSQSLKELKDEQEAKGEDFPIPVNFVPFFQLNVGVKGRLTESLFMLIDAGIWDGFLLRGGLAYRF